MKKRIIKFYLIYEELKKYNKESSNDDLRQATNDLIKYSNEEYIDSSFLREYNNDNRKPLDQIFNKNKNQNFLDFYFYKEDEKDQLEINSFSKFKKINNYR